MTNNEKCPLCGTELEEFGFMDWESCPDCDYVKSDSSLINKKHQVYEIAEILTQIIDEIKNINTDDEIEEMEENLEKCKRLLRMILELEEDSTNPFETEDDPIYPSPKPFPGNPPKKPLGPKPGDTYWQEAYRNNTHTKQSDADSFLSSGNYSTSERIDSLEEIIKGKISNDED